MLARLSMELALQTILYRKNCFSCCLSVCKKKKAKLRAVLLVIFVCSLCQVLSRLCVELNNFFLLSIPRLLFCTALSSLQTRCCCKLLALLHSSLCCCIRWRWKKLCTSSRAFFFSLHSFSIHSFVYVGLWREKNT